MARQWQRERRGGAAEVDDAEPSKRLVRPLGQGDALARWQRAARRLALPHGLVVEGARGVGKTTVLQWLAAALLCPSELDPDEPCGVCRTCTLVANELHPDMHVVRRAQDEADRKEHKQSYYVLTVDQVRLLETQLRRHAIEGRARVCLIADADCLAEEGQNALLKTLEEPGTATFLLLEASKPEQLLPTVRSRVQRLRVLPLSEQGLSNALQQRNLAATERFDDVVRLAAGSLGRAELLATEQVVQLHDLVRGWLAATHGLRPVATARSVLTGVTERHHEVEVARLFLWLLRSELRSHCQTLASQADGSYVAESLEPWTTWVERTLQAERDLDLMIPPEQVLTACLVALSS